MKKETPNWKIEFRLLMGKVVGWRDVEVDDILEKFIEKLLKEKEKELDYLRNKLYKEN